ncbi:metallophosphoesterase family protein [Caldisalinibacter kiritimatiensis]|uniref:Exonuclease SbcD n=1 Tax=Caldisalinibacter kiritimatiensis TaxID=1304284 RepID=R1CMI7_9FIRM|nr:metallophosphoesterase [Caldisalinibacter kiritimatiensis]EOC99915.1 Exonuclease SbcD [Caldisalinibacter kiritimatiensis]
MELKILHTGDLHIGMKFNNYPDTIREELVSARFEVIDRLVEQANTNKCNIFLVAGDLFDNINRIPKKDIDKVIKSLNKFEGECIVILPGNHDYDNGMSELWDNFNKNITDKFIIMNENRPYKLKKYDLDVVIYPAYCNSKHSQDNNLGWIKELQEKPEGRWHIGIAHGALETISPDIENKYFNMTEDELEEIELDLWCLGHTHIPYPNEELVNDIKIFNAGTPEPDGMDCSHNGNAWIIAIDEEKNIEGKRIKTGRYEFKDLKFLVKDEDDFKKIKREVLTDKPEHKLVRLTLKGRIEKELFSNLNILYEELRDKLGYFYVDDSQLKVKITKDIIDREFTKDSFPYRLLTGLSKNTEDDEALQIAYELIKGVKE